MVDTRLPDRWLYKTRFDNLSADAWRLFTLAMMWSNQQTTNGHVPTRFLPTLHPYLDVEALIPELQACDLLEVVPDGIQFLDWTGELGQSSREAVEERRRQLREAQASYRARKAITQSRGGRDRVIDDVGQASGRNEASSPVSYASDDVIDYCKRHPNGDTGEPCGGCARVAAAKKSTVMSERQALEKRCRLEGHDFPRGDRYCLRCGAKRDENAWMDPDTHATRSQREGVS